MPATDQASDSFGEFVATRPDPVPGLALQAAQWTTTDLVNTRLAVEAAYQAALAAQDLTALSQLQANFNALPHRAEIGPASSGAAGPVAPSPPLSRARR